MAMVISVRDQRLPFSRLIHRGLGLPEFFDAADRALARLVPFDASCWLSLDPATLLPTSHFSREYGFDHLLQLASNEFFDDDVNRFADLALAPQPAATMRTATGGDLARSPRHVGFLAPFGFGDGDELRVVFRDGESAWGAAVLHRRAGPFLPDEVALTAELGEVLAHGIRRAILTGTLAMGTQADRPGMVLLDGNDAIDTASPAGRRWIGELLDTTAATNEVPLVLASVAHRARLAGSGRSDDIPSVRVPRRTGGWLRLDGSLTEDGERVVILISPAREPEVADLIAQVYGLTTRERDVTRLTLQGRSTREMALALNLSPYTVQDHLKSIFDKVEVRSRRELVAQLFLQQCAPRLAEGLPPGPDGWFREVTA